MRTGVHRLLREAPWHEKDTGRDLADRAKPRWSRDLQDDVRHLAPWPAPAIASCVPRLGKLPLTRKWPIPRWARRVEPL